ncbi:putative helix-turn-helix domain protein [Streptomyces himastatinicus ATCC 53653]|uniref:Putative helix-turn-helix domain protein n=1 Tax=Streptomyces himastatinicus ATCC 53653 TaxID=457427 RepID=D9WPK0_9ACTN|nr:helix-turn-helix transcriptional regulator [Streptomyces himastatinicus]EFL21865.1 putative helix-turn-helix domain protein [Streptomyces himastatinicus ATCC 53653]
MEHKNSRGKDLATPADFAAWLKRQLEHRGYDLRPRGGGQTRFAEDSGIGAGTVSRMLRGQAATETRVLQMLADTLQIPLAEVLVAAGVLSRGELQNVRNPAQREVPITPEEAADELGITDPIKRQVFVSMTETLRQQRAENGDGRIAEN